MSYDYLKAVEFDKCSAAFKKQFGDVDKLCIGNDNDRWVWEPKYDGCYGIVDLEQGKMFSRTGEPVAIMQDMAEQLRRRAPSHWRYIIGEVWAPNTPFPVISGQFRLKDKRKQTVPMFFAMHDALTGKPDPSSYGARRQCLLDWYTGLEKLDEGAIPYTFIVHQARLELSATITAQTYVGMGGYDGIVIKDSWASYTPGLAKDGQIIKVKPSLSLDLTVDAVFVDTGEKTGRAVYKIAVLHAGRGIGYSLVGSGMPHVLSPDLIPGAIVEIEAMGWTPDGNLREPRFKGVRHDKTQPDM